MKCLTNVWRTCRNRQHEHPKPTTYRQKTGTSTEKIDKRKRSELEDGSLRMKCYRGIISLRHSTSLPSLYAHVVCRKRRGGQEPQSCLVVRLVAQTLLIRLIIPFILLLAWQHNKTFLYFNNYAFSYLYCMLIKCMLCLSSSASESSPL